MNLLNVGGTLTGGTTVALTPAGISPGRSVFVGPDHSRNRTDVVTLTANSTPSNAKTGAAGVGRIGTQMKQSIPIAPADGCCTSATAEIQFDTSVKVNSLADDTALDAAIDRYRALVYTAAWKTAVKSLILPQS